MKRLLVATLLILGLLLPGTSAAAGISDALISILDIKAFQDDPESGDMEVIFQWRWQADNVSATPASSAVLIVLSYNGTAVASAVPYVFPPFDDNGYGQAVQGFYLSANSSPQWGSTLYSIQIAGLPSVFGADPPVFNYSLTAGDYSTATTLTTNRAEMKTFIIGLIDDLADVYTNVRLKAAANGQQVLSDYGEAYFPIVIPGLETLCPELFFVQQYIPESLPTTAYNNSLQTTLSGRMEGTDLNRGMGRVGGYIGVSAGFMWGILALVIAVLLIIKTQQAGWDITASYSLAGGVVVAISYLAGGPLFTIMMVGSFLAVMAIGRALWGKKT